MCAEGVAVDEDGGEEGVEGVDAFDLFEGDILSAK